MAQVEVLLDEGLTEVALDGRAHLLRVRGDASCVARELRTAATDAMSEGRTAVIVDLSAATGIHGPLAWELTRAHARLLWRSGRVVVIADASALEPLFGAFALHRSPDVVPSLEAGLKAANVSEAGMAVAHASKSEVAPAPTPGPPGAGAGAAEAPFFAWRKHDELPASWSFELRGGAEAPGVARAAIGRVLQGRLPDAQRRNTLLLVSEVVTNSVLHGGAAASEAVTLSVNVTPDRVRVEVGDPEGGFVPPEYPNDPLRLRGRGLPMIHSLARAWGVGSPPGGRVWFEMPMLAA
jgi:anti-sigma regulatory factor (Ser/Thr protein kinase)